jgi:hypothetical protein
LTVFLLGFVATALENHGRGGVSDSFSRKKERKVQLTLRFSLSTNRSLTPFLNSTALLLELSLIGTKNAGSTLPLFLFGAGVPSSSRVLAEVEAIG